MTDDTSSALWIKDPLAILAHAAERGIVVQGSRIVELVAAGREPRASVVKTFDAGAHVVLPGLINTHHHFYQTLTRAVPAALDRELFPWLQALYPLWARLTPEAVDLASTLAIAELMLSGCTLTTDHHYVFPKGVENGIDIQVAAAKRLGLRALLTRGSMNRSQRDGGLPPDSVAQDEDTILADSERVVARYHQAGDGAMIQIALAPCSPFSVTTSLMRATAELAERLDVRMHTHLAETEDENRYCLDIHQCRPLDYLEECGSLNGRTWLAHGVHFNPDEFKRLASAGTAVTHCACSNQVLASGTCPVCAGRSRCHRGAGSRRLGLERLLQSHAGSASRVSAAARPLWHRQGQSPRRLAMGHQRLGGLRRAHRRGRYCRRHAGRFRAVPARRGAVLRLRRSARGACVVRGPSRRPRDGGRPLDRGEWANSRPRRGRPDAAACGGGAGIAGLRKSRAALAPVYFEAQY
jgi:cytosine/adenosine deaminase-related metal-dependent hydrolase